MTELPNRRISRRKALGWLLAGAGAGAIDAFVLGPRWLEVTRREISCPGLPPGLDGLRVGVLSDIHFKPGRSDALLEKAVGCLMEEQPDLITLPGDFIDHTRDVVSPMMRILSRLSAPHGVFASMGNHDGWTRSGAVLRCGFEQNGVSFLVNQHSRLRIRGEDLAIAATDHIWLGKPDPARALRGIPLRVPVVSLVHEPDFFDQMITQRPITLQVSGHTHGGQCQVPMVGYAPVRVAYGENYLEGIYQQGDSRLFVSRGVGTTGLPVRFACRPEVAVLTLRTHDA